MNHAEALAAVAAVLTSNGNRGIVAAAHRSLEEDLLEREDAAEGYAALDTNRQLTSLLRLPGYVTGLVADSVGAAAANTDAINAKLSAARTSNNGRARYTTYLPAGSFYINDTVLLDRQFGLSLLGAGKRNTNLLWAGASGGTMMRVHSVRDANIGGFGLIGDGTGTLGMDLDATSGNLVATHNTYRDLLLDTHDYGMRIGQSNFQVSECTFWNCDFYRSGVACVSIEDSNAVNHHFFECYFTASPIGITAVLNGNGGSFCMFGCGATSISTVWAQFYPSSRGHTMENCWAENISGLYAKLGGGGSTGSTLTIKEGSVNQTQHASQYIIEHASSGTIIVQGGKYSSGVSNSPVKIHSTGPNGRRQMLILDGALFDGDPISGSWLPAAGPVIVRGPQIDFVPDSGNTRPAQIAGPIAYGTRAAPLTLATSSGFAGAAWYKISAGTVLSAGLNSFTGSNKNVQGKTFIRVDVSDWGGLTTQGATVTAKDDDATLDRQFVVEVRMTTGFTLTSDLVFRAQFEPELIVH